LIIAADEPRIVEAAEQLRDLRAQVTPIQADLATLEGVDKLYNAAQGRFVDVLMANAGRGLGGGFLDQNFEDARRVVDTNITGTIALIQRVGRDMRAHHMGRILITG
jgi:short-subunit dehydrogenase